MLEIHIEKRLDKKCTETVTKSLM